MDYTLFKDINGLSGNALSDDGFTFAANYLPIVVIALVALSFLSGRGQHREQRRAGAVLGTTAAAVALLVNQGLAHAVDRPRPYVAHAGTAHLLIARSGDPSFPSDHATGAFALAFGIWLYDRTIGTVLLVLAAVLGFSRVYVGTHYPGDVLAGAVIGVAAAGALYVLPASRRLIAAIAARCGRLWDRLRGGSYRAGTA